MESLGIAIAALAAVALASSAGAARVPEPDVLDADDPLVIDDVRGDLDITGSGPSDEDLVLAAQKLRTTVQEAPSIIYVVTRRQIEERGYRTVNDVLRTVPGFEGDRWEGNGWQRENFARGLPNTVLVLVNGVNIVEPLRNMAALDRKIPLEIVERIEVTSGPGGVLWGSNALLGVVNIVTRRIDDTGLQALVGAGDGPGDRVAVKGALGYSARLSEDVGLWLHANFYSSEGPELLLDSQKVLGSLPEPADDTPTLYLPESLELSSGERDWHLTLAGRLELGTVSLDWLIPFERDHRAIATGGAPLTVDYLDPARGGRASSASDVVRVVQLTWADRFANDDVGVKVRAFGVQWDVDEDPFGVYPASPAILAGRGHTKDLHLSLVGELQVRAGLAADVDVRVTDALRILAGGEAYVDVNEGLNQTAWVIDELGTCPEGFVYDPDDPYLPCRFTERQVQDVSRLGGGGFVSLDWRVVDQLALNAGLRVQASSQFDPALLYSGGLVWNPVDTLHIKAFVSTGLRPPPFVATHVRDTVSSISFKANPDLDAETSRSYELEINAVLLRDEGEIRDLYLRANGAFTEMDNVIKRPAGVYANSGEQQIVSAEAFARLRFQEGHELWANYTFTRVYDDSVDGGRLLNLAEHMANIGGKLVFLDDHIELFAGMTFKSELVDPNRPPLSDPTRPDYSLRCDRAAASGLSKTHPLRQLCGFPSLSGGVWVLPGTSVDETIAPVTLLDLGVRFKNLWRDLSISIFVYNVFDFRTYDPDFFEDPRVISRPQPKPGMSFFGQISFGL